MALGQVLAQQAKSVVAGVLLLLLLQLGLLAAEKHRGVARLLGVAQVGVTVVAREVELLKALVGLSLGHVIALPGRLFGGALVRMLKVHFVATGVPTDKTCAQIMRLCFGADVIQLLGVEI